MSRRFALALAVLVLAACATTPADMPTLAGTQWRFTAIDGKAPASDKAELRFEAERLAATTGCNRMAGPWRVEDGRLVVGPLIMTKMFCQGPIGEQEAAVSELLSGSPAVALEDGRLTLSTGGHAAELERR